MVYSEEGAEDRTFARVIVGEWGSEGSLGPMKQID
jgi:hypothetical protein